MSEPPPSPCKPVLTVGIPTYCRADLLDVCLASVLPQVEELNDRVECVVSDNASTDHTGDVLKRYQDRFECLKVFRNDSNLGIIHNITKTASKLSAGNYVFLIGDDDVLTAGAIHQILKLLETEPAPDLIALNVGYLPRSSRPGPDSALGGVSVNCTKILRSQQSRCLVRLGELFDGPPADFTASYSVVMRRSAWISVFPEACREPPFSSLKTTYPSGFVIAETMTDARVSSIEEPSVIIYEMPGAEFSWARFRGVTSTRFATELIHKFEQAGVPSERLLPYKRYQLEHRSEELGEMLWDKETAGGWMDALRFAWLLKRNPLGLAKVFVLSLLHPKAPFWLTWIPRLTLKFKQMLRPASKHIE
ncbi:glycosyltransferase family 2 protein [Pirellulaceae bacterium SH449]